MEEHEFQNSYIKTVKGPIGSFYLSSLLVKDVYKRQAFRRLLVINTSASATSFKSALRPDSVFVSNAINFLFEFSQSKLGQPSSN